ncbi:MarR family transcriptional regulator [Pseudoalteromonas sp. MMG024]|uniref:MarR family winged helix-turn-helix transcriptional regulator n=1 Tax=Pseudoalteromonas sp. MMG024 TaxID=2909980 RepID=UPI001EFF8EC8|nr:MarR family transcriptional regulator [Pseudoalteromonas sp. MMG024]MCF6458157.1 MarR family transcriptional regulator [Pseudoalteromonas sp. MMG024]
MKHSPEGALLTSIILDIFRLNGLLIQEGDKLVKELGLTSARWKVLGALSSSNVPLTVSDIARNMGQSRQSVQRLANEMTEEGLLVNFDNPNDKRAKLYSLAESGVKSFAEAMEKQSIWANKLVVDIPEKELENTSNLLQKITLKLD